MNLTLRMPQPEDYAAIATWVPDAKACIRWAGPLVPFPFAVAELQQLLIVSNGESYCLVAPGTSPFGFGQHFIVEQGSVHLGRIIVSPTARRRGVGRELCKQLMSRAIKATAAGAVTLRVYRDNPAALHLYSSLGFIPVESRSTEEVLFMEQRANPSFKRTGLRPAA